MTVAVEAEDARRIVVIVRPAPSDDGLLRVDDALKQVLDFLRVADDAKASLGLVDEDFEWRLESASTNTPFTITAAAEPISPGVDVSAHAYAVKGMTAKAIQDCSDGIPVPAWLTGESSEALSSFFRRITNGVARTILSFKGDLGTIEVGPEQAINALPFLERPLTALEAEIPPRIAYGELDGRMVAVGRHYNRPAIQLVTALYGIVWCVLSDALVERYGGEQTIGDVWSGKRLTVYGRLTYVKGGQRPSRIEVETIHERVTPDINIYDVLDPDFTAGMDPVEYLERLHGGDLG